MKVVITGGCGFLGQQLAGSLLRRGSLTGPSGDQDEITDLVLFDAVAPSSPAPDDDRVEVVIGDITDRATIFSLCDRDDLSVFHMASVMSGGGEESFDRASRRKRRRQPERPRGSSRPCRLPASGLHQLGGGFRR